MSISSVELAPSKHNQQGSGTTAAGCSAAAELRRLDSFITAAAAAHVVPAAAAAAPGLFSLASWSADSPVVDAEPGLFGLLDHYGLPDELALQVAEALEGLESAQQQQQQQQHAERLARFAADYAQVRLWAGRGRAGLVQAAVARLVRNALG
ncbi:hypothetical protein OEZ85_007102 [Tetradesmus obliquus]|uniref:Uncharacterized protein n=1 Tax=Tetradesmus obliquus TaxID=3088 RepID=A0ABY8TWM3_TETOB|nr:hypothetical protein OEZ85_007102 [Tetradesmus obliquus]